MQIGIVGLPFSGKTTLFQAVTRTLLDQVALARQEAHVGVVKVPDRRLGTLAAMFLPKSVVHATIEFVDVVGLKPGESGSTQFSTQFLSKVRTNDALVQVVRLFADETVPHPDGSIDPLRDIAAFETEFILSDLALLEGRIERINKQLQKGGDEQGKKELPLLERCQRLLEQEQPLREAEFSAEERTVLRNYQFLSLKPMLIALNLHEHQQASAESFLQEIRTAKQGRQTAVLSFCGRVDMEIAQLSDEEVEAFMVEYGMTELALHLLIRESYSLLGLQSFFTVGEDECRAWTIRKGMTAQEAAGVIHSDFFAKFIRAEAVGYDEFVGLGGSFAKAKEAGLWRLEGKDYIVKDGDILSIRHS